MTTRRAGKATADEATAAGLGGAGPPSRLPFLTGDMPAIPGVIKLRPEDFFVQEIPLYQPRGSGTHSYFFVEKVGLSTMRAARTIAAALNVKVRCVGYAGLKDAQAVARQLFSLEHVEPRRIAALQLPRIRILWVSKHDNKLRLGHLRANRFIIKLRRTDTGRIDQVRQMLQILSRRGVPNYFGPQRFGARADTWRIGRAMLRQDWRECIDVMLGRPGPGDAGRVLRARQLYEAGRPAEAASAWPHPFRDERRACRRLAKTGSHRQAFAAVDRSLKRLYVSAYQGWLFNRVVAERIEQIDRIWPGDLAWRHANGAVFRVEDLPSEQRRCEAFEISPTGPLFGYRMTWPTGQAGRLEQQILQDEGLSLSDFRAERAHKVKGGRRPLRFQPADWSVEPGRDELGEFLELRFALPPGCYATALLRELCKRDLAEH